MSKPFSPEYNWNPLRLMDGDVNQEIIHGNEPDHLCDSCPLTFPER